MTALAITQDAAQILGELTTQPPMGGTPIYDAMVAEKGFDPSGDAPGTTFGTWNMELPSLTMQEAVEAITGSPYQAWIYSDSAALLRFLNAQPTREWAVIDGYVVTPGE